MTAPQLDPTDPPADQHPPAETVESLMEKLSAATAEAEKWKGFSRQNEDRAKANAEAARKLKEIEDRDLSELQKAQRDLAEAQERASNAERAALRSQVALGKGIPPELVDALAGSTAEELSAHADRLLAWRGTPTPPLAPPATQPRPDASQGAQPLPDTSADDATYEQYKQFIFPSHQQ